MVFKYRLYQCDSLLIFYYHVPQFNFAKRQKCLELIKTLMKVLCMWDRMWVYVFTASFTSDSTVAVAVAIIIIIVCLGAWLLACCLKFHDLMWKIEIFKLFPIAIVVRHDSSWKLKLIGFSCFFSFSFFAAYLCVYLFIYIYVLFCRRRQTIYFLHISYIFFSH